MHGFCADSLAAALGTSLGAKSTVTTTCAVAESTQWLLASCSPPCTPPRPEQASPLPLWTPTATSPRYQDTLRQATFEPDFTALDAACALPLCPGVSELYVPGVTADPWAAKAGTSQAGSDDDIPSATMDAVLAAASLAGAAAAQKPRTAPAGELYARDRASPLFISPEASPRDVLGGFGASAGSARAAAVEPEHGAAEGRQGAPAPAPTAASAPLSQLRMRHAPAELQEWQLGLAWTHFQVRHLVSRHVACTTHSVPHKTHVRV